MQLSEQMVTVDEVVQNACAMLSVVLSLETGWLLLTRSDSVYTFPRHG
jgi:hypothetical protein